MKCYLLCQLCVWLSIADNKYDTDDDDDDDNDTDDDDNDNDDDGKNEAC